MTDTLHDDLTLLDLLDSLPRSAAPTDEQLTERLVTLCQQQGLTPTPADIQRTVALYQKQQHTDRQLVGILADLPAASTAQASAEALLQRLQVQCTEQQLTVTPENLNRAVTLFQDQQRPFILWKRPASEAERKQALAVFQKKLDMQGNIMGGIILVGLGIVMVATLSLLGAMALDIQKHADFIKTMFGTILGTVTGGIFISLPIMLSLEPTMRQMPWPYRKWFRAKEGTWPLLAMKRLNPAAPNPARLQSWLNHPEAKQALTLLSKTPVPITEEDAERLDVMVMQTRTQQQQAQQAQDAQVWAAGLQQLRDSQS